jgi:hypothetical protein
MNQKEFDALVRQVLDELPPELRRHIANVAVVVEERADGETLALAEVDDPLDLMDFITVSHLPRAHTTTDLCHQTRSASTANRSCRAAAATRKCARRSADRCGTRSRITLESTTIGWRSWGGIETYNAPAS